MNHFKFIVFLKKNCILLLCLNLFNLPIFAIEKIPPDIASSYRLIGIEKTLIGFAERMMSSQEKIIDINTQFISASAANITLSSTYKILKNKSELNLAFILYIFI